MKRFEKILLLLLIISVNTSCIKEDLDDCEKTRLTFIYKGDGQEDIFHTKINKVDLYVFDTDHHLVTTKVLNQSTLKKHQGTKLNLPSGQYHLVAVGNAGERTTIKDIQCGSLQNIMAMHPNQDKDKVPGQDPLYMGCHVIEVLKDRWSDHTVEFKSSHLKVSVEVRGVGYAGTGRAANPSVSVVLKNVYPHTNFTNESCGELCAHHPEFVFDENTHVMQSTDLNIFRYKGGCAMVIEVLNREGNVIASKSIAEFLRENPKVDIYKQEALLPLLIEFTPLQVEIRLPEWYINDVTPDFH